MSKMLASVTNESGPQRLTADLEEGALAILPT